MDNCSNTIWAESENGVREWPQYVEMGKDKELCDFISE